MGNVLEAWFGRARKLALLNLCIPSDGSSCLGGDYLIDKDLPILITRSPEPSDF